jgi:hypothetical protein
MSTKREQIFAALFALWAPLATAGLIQAPMHNQVLPERLDDGSLPILNQDDGGLPGKPDVTLSPVSYTYDENVELQILAQNADAAALRSTVDDIIAGIGTQLAIDRTLGALCNDVRVLSQPKIEDRAVDGAPQLRAATILVRLNYTTSDPLA